MDTLSSSSRGSEALTHAAVSVVVSSSSSPRGGDTPLFPSGGVSATTTPVATRVESLPPSAAPSVSLSTATRDTDESGGSIRGPASPQTPSSTTPFPAAAAATMTNNNSTDSLSTTVESPLSSVVSSSGGGGGNTAAAPSYAVGAFRVSYCPICFEGFNFDNPAMVLPCGHVFHMQCHMSWRQRSKLCAVCQCLVSDADIRMMTPHDLVDRSRGKEHRGKHRQSSSLPPVSAAALSLLSSREEETCCSATGVAVLQAPSESSGTRISSSSSSGNAQPQQQVQPQPQNVVRKEESPSPMATTTTTAAATGASDDRCVAHVAAPWPAEQDDADDDDSSSGSRIRTVTRCLSLRSLFSCFRKSSSSAPSNHHRQRAVNHHHHHHHSLGPHCHASGGVQHVLVSSSHPRVGSAIKK